MSVVIQTFAGVSVHDTSKGSPANLRSGRERPY